VTVAKFLSPRAVTDPAEFFHLWRSLGGPPLKLQQVLTVKPALAHAGMPAIKALLNSLKLNVVDGLDPNPANLVTAACMGVAAAAAAGELVCITRLESDANNAAQFRLTVATSNQIASSCIRELVLHHLTT
jgi:AP-2 complex subunit alpha